MPAKEKKKIPGAKRVRKAGKNQRRRKNSKSGKTKIKQRKTIATKEAVGATNLLLKQRCACTHRSHPEDVDGSTRCTKELKFPGQNNVCPECKAHVKAGSARA